MTGQRVAVVGAAGSAGARRADAVSRIRGFRLCSIVDVPSNQARLAEQARQLDCNWSSDWRETLTSGEIDVAPVAVDGADAYEFRFVPTVNGAPGTPVTQFVTKTRPATTITGLTPGTTYTIQVRSFADATGFTDWSDPVIRIVT